MSARFGQVGHPDPKKCKGLSWSATAAKNRHSQVPFRNIPRGSRVLFSLMDSDKRSLISEIITLAADHGLSLQNNMDFNEMGIDFRIAFATAKDGTPWVLRIPRRDDLAAQIDKEKNILQLARRHLSVAVPDWHIATPSLIAYPLLTDRPVLTFDATTYEVTWYMDRESPLFVPSLAKVLVEL